MSEENKNMVETVEFRAIAPKSDLRGLDAALNKLNALDVALKTVQNRLAGLTTGSAFKLSAAQFAAAVPSKGPQDIRKMAKLWGFPDVRDVQNVAREVEGELQRSIERIQRKLAKTPRSPSGSTRARDALNAELRSLRDQSLFTDPTASALRNPTRAGQFAELYAKRAMVNRGNAERAIMGLLSGTVGPAVAPSSQGFFPVQPGTSSGRSATESTIVEKTGGRKAAATAGSKFADALEKIKLELATNLNTGDLTGVAGARQRAAEQIRALVEAGDGVKQRTKDKALTFAANQTRQADETRQQILEESSANTFNLRKKLAMAEKAGQKEKAKQLQAEIDAEEQRIAGLKQLNQVFYKPLAQQQQKAETAKQQAAAVEARRLEDETRRREQHIAVQKQWETFMAQPGAEETGRSGRLTLGKTGQWTRMLEGRRPMANGRTETFRADIGNEATFTRGTAEPPVKHDRLNSALAGLNMRDMAANVIKVTTWAAAVGVLYKSLELAEYSLSRLEKTGMAMAHLGIVFRGVGGDAHDLTEDTIRLAAAEGRSTDEAMESAVEWSRLGGNRKAVNEEVRVSAMAANIANISMAETTKQLSALMHIYHLQAGDLNGVLGMLTNTSLKYNVTLDEMFVGLDRSAAAAKVAGVGLAELQAMIGVVVGGTGQSGSMTGNSIKYILQELNKSDVQKQLRGFGVEPLTNKLEQKPAGQMLAELHGVWGTMGRREQGSLSGLLGGRFNAARVPVLLENYPRVLQLAIDGQLNLNKAQEANIKILDTLQAQLAGVKAQWDKLVINRAGTQWAYGLMVVKSALGALSGGDAASEEEHRGKIIDKIKSRGAIHRAIDMAYLAANTASHISSLGFGANNRPGLVEYNHRTALAMQTEKFTNDLQKLQSETGAHHNQMVALGMAAKTIQNGTMTAENANAYASIMNQAGSNGTGFLNAFQGGDKAGALKIIDSAQTKASSDAAASEQRAQQKMLEQRSSLESQKQSLIAAQAAKIKLGKSDEQERKELDDVNEALRQNTQDLSDNATAQGMLEGELAGVMITQQKYISLLKAQGDALERMSHMAELVRANTPTGELDQQAAGLKAQLDFLVASQQAFKASPDFNTTEGVAVNTQMLEDIKKVRAQYDAVAGTLGATGRENPFSSVNRGLARREGEMQIGIRRADRDASGQKFGVDEAQKLENERLHLTQRIAALSKETNADDQQAGELLEAKNLLFQNGLSILQRQADVQREIKQLAIDQNKEFMKSFMGAGPAEMLQKLAAFRLSFDNKGGRKSPVSQGAYFAMSPGMRGDYGQLNPQYNPSMIFLKQEQERLDALMKKYGGGIPDANKHPATTNGGRDLAGAAFETAANGIRAGGQMVADAFKSIIDRLNSIVPQASFRGHGGGGSWSDPVNAQSGGNGGGHGFVSRAESEKLRHALAH